MKNNQPIIITQTFPVATEIVWKAITDADHMKRWYFENIPDFKPKVGFQTEFVVRAETRVFLHQWKVTDAILGKKISYEWTFKGYQGKSITHWELNPIKNKTALVLTSEIIEPFPDDISEFERESGVAGWNYFIKERLFAYLENKS